MEENSSAAAGGNEGEHRENRALLAESEEQYGVVHDDIHIIFRLLSIQYNS